MCTKLKGTFSYAKTMENAEMRDMNVPFGAPEEVVKTSSSSKFTFTVKGVVVAGKGLQKYGFHIT